MASSGNFSTFNPLDNATSSGYGTATFGNGNTEATGASTGHCGIASTIATGNTGKYYAEFYLVATSGNAYLGYYSSQQTVTMITASNKWVPNSGVTWNPANLASYFQDGTLYKDGSTTSSWGSSYSTTDIIQIAIDADNDAVYYGKNNTWQNSGDPTSGASKTGAARTSIPKNIFPAVGHANGGSSTVTWRANFGQDSTFGGTISAGGNADANGFGDFKYAPPSGYVALCSANLPISDDIDPAQTDDDYPAKNFNVVLYSGNASTNAITGLGLKPDLIWIKGRNDSTDNRLVDSTRGVGVALRSNADGGDVSEGNGVTAFGTDGFTLGSETGYNGSSINFVSWCWKANGGVTSSNSSGDITSTVQANTKGGFSIMTYTGTGSNATIGHGLSAKPDLIFTKRRSSSQTWGVYHSALGATKYLALNSNAAAGTDSAFWNNTEPTDSLITFGTEGRVNANSQTYVAYVWHNVEGYSKFGSYEGNANNDGPFVYTGFRPRMLWIKEADNADDWVVYDTARDTFNRGSSRVLRYENATAEFDGSTRAIDILSNGFKIRTSNNTINQSSTFVYGCFGDVPFKYNNTF